jgi:alpha-galactosidase
MFTMRRAHALRVIVAAALVAGSARGWAENPVTEELALRDRWVAEHFPTAPTGPTTTPEVPPAPAARLMVWTSYDRVYCNQLPTLPLRVADETFQHGVFCHAPSRVQVILPSPGKSFAARVGILTNPNSQGGSVICSVDLGDKPVYASPVLHRGEPAVDVSVDLANARDFYMGTSCAGDGISSDQAVWGDATVTLEDGTTLRVGDLPLVDPWTQWREAATPPFSFTYDGRHSDQLLPQWKFQENRDASTPGRITRVRTYTDAQTGLIVRCTIVEYVDYPTVEWTLSFENAGREDLPILAGILPLDTRLARGEGNEFVLHHAVGSPCQPNDYEPLSTTLGPRANTRITTQGGRPTNSDLPYFNLETGNDGGVIAVISWAGQWAANFARDEGRQLHVTGGQECTWFRLHPGEQVRSPLIVLQFYRGEWTRAQNVWRSWMLKYNVPRRNGQLLEPFIYACFGNYYPGLMTDAATEKQFLSRYFEEDIRPDYWNQDAGWYPCAPEGWPKVGTWEVDRTRWPNGVREVTDWLKQRGTKSILWFEPERVYPGTWLAENHPEWIIGGRNGGLLNIGDPACRAWVTDHVSDVLTTEGIDFYRQDFNIDPLIDWRGNDADDRQGITEIHHVEGYFAYWDELVRRHPDLWIDSCASGGRRNDLETLRRAVPILRSDWVGDPVSPPADPSDQQNHVYGISFWMPYHGSGFISPNQYLARSLMGPIFGIGVDPRRQDVDFDLIRNIYRDVRQVQPCYLGDFYPLTPYSRDLNVWTAWQFDRPDRGEGVVQAFRRQLSDCAETTFKLMGLDAHATYEVTDLDAPDTSRALTGNQLMHEGLVISINDQPGAALVHYRRK